MEKSYLNLHVWSQHVPRHNEEIVTDQELSTYRHRFDRDTFRTEVRNHYSCVTLLGGIQCNSYAVDMTQVLSFEQKYTNAYKIVCIT